MGRSNIRLGQLISTFGPGALMVDRYGTSLILCGLDWWFYQEPDAVTGVPTPAEEKAEFLIEEWRLQQRLEMDYFMEPPDFRIPMGRREANEPREQNPNLKLTIPTLRFPSYFVCNKVSCNSLVQEDYHRGQRPRCGEHEGYSRMNQVRFITVCRNGHINDFPWKRLLGCGDSCAGKLRLNEQGSSDLASIKVSCSCGKVENLGGTTSYDRLENGDLLSVLSERIRKNTGSDEAGNCQGRRLWHGPKSYESCSEDIVATFPNATNVYYSNSKTSIFIPIQQSGTSEIEEIRAFFADPTALLPIKALWEIDKSQAVEIAQTLMAAKPDSFSDLEKAKEKALDALTQEIEGVPVLQTNCAEPSLPESAEAQFRRVEYNVLRQRATEEDLRTNPIDIPDVLSNFFHLVVQVERLKETRVLHGFDRFMTRETESMSPAELGADALDQLFSQPPERPHRWLPGKVVFGEGIYLELKEEAIKSWLSEQRPWIDNRLKSEHNYYSRFPQLGIEMAEGMEISVEWVARYLLLHTFAHIVINQFIFECGYSTASLKERLYVSGDPTAPMAGMLIYTSAGDSEGTLGGLVRLAQKDLLGGVITRACQRASWCSADPVCSEVTNTHDQNLAACHSCVLLPETSCEIFNKGLDRAMVVGSPREPNAGFFSDLLQFDRQTIVK